MNKLFSASVFTRSLILVMYQATPNKKGKQGVFKGASVEYQIFTDKQSLL